MTWEIAPLKWLIYIQVNKWCQNAFYRIYLGTNLKEVTLIRAKTMKSMTPLQVFHMFVFRSMKWISSWMSHGMSHTSPQKQDMLKMPATRLEMAVCQHLPGVRSPACDLPPPCGSLWGMITAATMQPGCIWVEVAKVENGGWMLPGATAQPPSWAPHLHGRSMQPPTTEKQRSYSISVSGKMPCLPILLNQLSVSKIPSLSRAIALIWRHHHRWFSWTGSRHHFQHWIITAVGPLRRWAAPWISMWVKMNC